MNWRSSTIGLALVILVSLGSTPCPAQDAIVKQLEATGSYDTAVGASAAGATTTAGASQDVQGRADQLTHEYRMAQEHNKVYEIIILSVLALVSLFIALRFLAAKSAYSATHIVNATGLICIIFGTILLVIMAQSDQQLTAAVGILLRIT